MVHQWKSLLAFYLTLLAFVLTELLDIPGLPSDVYELQGDINIGGLFPLHQPGKNGSYCGALRELGVLQRAEAMAFYINKINNDTSILPGVKLGFIILDDCYKETTALAQSLKFVQRTSSNTSKHGARDVVAVIGAESSSNSKQVAELLGLFEIPQVSYLSTSSILSDEIAYPYFTRIVPSDEFQIPAIIELLKTFNWQYVSFVYSSAAFYGKDAYRIFDRELRKSGNNICLAADVPINETASENDYKAAVNKLVEGSDGRSAHVVILFLPHVTAVNLLATAQSMNLTGKFTWIASDAWGRNVQDFRGIESIAEGTLSFKISSSNDENFDKHFAKLSPRNSLNPFMKEFWDFSCNQSSNQCQQARKFEDLEVYKPETTISLVQTAVYLLAYQLSELQAECKISSALEGASSCEGAKFRKYVTGKELQAKLRGLEGCIISNNNNTCIDINKKGEGLLQYSVLNFYRNTSNHSFFEKVAYYNTAKHGNLVMLKERQNLCWNRHIDQINFKDQIPQSICSQPCLVGQEQVRTSVGFRNSKCCWHCQNCASDEITKIVQVDGLDTIRCSKCGQLNTSSLVIHSTPSKSFQSCELIVPKYMDLEDPSALVIIILDVICVVATTLLITLYIINRHHRLIKATSKELSSIILSGIIFSYISIIFFFMPLQRGCSASDNCDPKPQTQWCYLQFISFSLSSTFITAPLITRVNRIYRIFKEGKKSGAKPRFIENKYQFMIVGILVTIQIIIVTICCLVSAFTGLEGIKVTNDVDPYKPVTYMSCVIPLTLILPPVCFNLLLTLVCAYHAFKTRKLPDNFNESKFIGLTVYTTVIMWIAFIPTYVTISNSLKVVPLCISLLINATITTSCLFVPRLYALRWVDRMKLNLRSVSMSISSLSGDMKHPCNDRRKSISTETIRASKTTMISQTSVGQKHPIDQSSSSETNTIILRELSSSSSPDSQYSTL